MANNYFRFKQFTVYQHNSAMKVCTDACLFGAWTAATIEGEKWKVENILDIGTGTGLLSLMLAQKTTAKIDAVEIEDNAVMQTEENFKASGWNERLHVCHTAIQTYNPSHTYDLIISNPPFFNRSLQSDNKQKNVAKHTGTLPFEELANAVSHLLHADGKFFLLLPFIEFEHFETVAKTKQLYLIEKADVKQSSNHGFFRSMGVFSKQPLQKISHETLIIKNEDNQYTESFIDLLKDYYLYL